MNNNNIYSTSDTLDSEVITVLDEPALEVCEPKPITPTRCSLDYQTFKAEVIEARASLDVGVQPAHISPEVQQNLEEDYHKISASDLLKKLETDQNKGLTTKDAEERLKKYGPNTIQPHKGIFMKIVRFFAHFFSGFALLLWPAAILCIIAWKPLGNPNPDRNNLVLAVILIVIIFIQGFFEIWQEKTSGKIMSGISSMLPSIVKVMRDGQLIQIAMGDLVPGDIVHLGLGDKVPADVRLLAVSGLKLDTSMLTGESEPVNCVTECTDAMVLESKNCAFLGTSVVEGSGVALVIHTGQKTVMGSITKAASKTKQATSSSALHKEIRRFVIVVSTLAISTGIMIIVVWAAWLRTSYPKFLTLSAAIVTALGAIVSFCPEGMPVCVTMTLTLIAKRMGTQKVLVKSLMTVETLGCVNVICSDKTGTLTMNKMAVMHLYIGQKLIMYGKEVVEMFASNQAMKEMYTIMSLCNRAFFEDDSIKSGVNINEREVIGDASDTAMLRFAEELDSVAELRARFPKICEIPFNSKNKYMLTICSQPDDTRPLLMMKGAAEIIMNRCSTLLDANGNEVPLTDRIKEDLVRQQEYFGECGERVLGIGRRYLSETDYECEIHEFNADIVNFPTNDLCLVGLVALLDKPRLEAGEAVEKLRKAGIRVAMVTGDHPTTATSIARMVNIVRGDCIKFSMESWNQYEPSENQKLYKKKTNVPKIVDQGLVVPGSEIPSLTDEAWNYILTHEELVFARTTPDQKLRIVKEFQKRKNVVAVTGDGVNDSPALKQADVGVSMGSGSDVAREAADLILLDNNFASVVVGAKYGRLVFENLKKVIAYLLPAGTFCEMLSILAVIFFGLPVPLSSILMISISVFTDVANCMTLIFEQPESDLMNYKPRSITGERIVNYRLFLQSYIFVGILQAVGAFGMWFWFMYQFGGFKPKELIFVFDKWTAGYMGRTQSELNKLTTQGQSVFFIALVCEQFGNLLLIRTRRVSFFKHLPWSSQSRNPWLPVGMFVSLCMAIMIVNIPLFQYLFGTASIPYKFYFAPIAIGMVIFFLDELRKLGTRRFPRVFFFSW